MLRTKIVCTIGPASMKHETLLKMVGAGMRVARFNFSHGNHEDHEKAIKAVRAAAWETKVPVGILLDTKGPEVRIGQVAQDKINLEKDKMLCLYPDDGSEGTEEALPISYADLASDVITGTKILIDDGNVELKVIRVEEKRVLCTVLDGGIVSSRKGLSVPGLALNIPAISAKEIADLEFAARNKVDFIAISFTRDSDDVLDIRRIIERHGASIQLIAKIENHEGVKNIDEILKVADGIMIARGDLGVEIPTEEVPVVQKEIIEKCNNIGKPVITATQMLDSMIRNPRPTRAEATDVANAIFDGTDAIMLSGETAAGKYPVEAVEMMARIASRAEQALLQDKKLSRCNHASFNNVTDSISHATCVIASDLSAKAIITLTKSGSTARMVSRYRPKCNIIASTPEDAVTRQLAIVWGVEPMRVKETKGTDAMLAEAIECAQLENRIISGDLVVVTAGVPVGVSGTTNMVKVHITGKIAARGMGIGKMTTTGKITICRTAEDLEKVEKGDILVAFGTDKEYIPAIERCKGIITVEGGLTSHAAIVGLHYNIPVIVGVREAMTALETGMEVTLDTERGLIYQGTAQVL
ncbi:pyruvate kinase [Heliorestis acidaminivorans]|uniref:Pyruvate kinase n=1 Tax=Heliorestis acidaminivorans TaxID=553427 RepID=A0A6I0F1V8_9FIRM|nr:pyruvate kinase [Heliorestis acidaminivorans]KAB2953298.1 pyruvate kinase [Heliorestis acidaminivorans]